MDKLTKEQLERAVRAAKEAVHAHFWTGCGMPPSVSQDAIMSVALKAAAAHLQYAQEAPEHVIEAMLYAAGIVRTDTEEAAMTAAFHKCAAWCRERMLQPPTGYEASAAQSAYSRASSMADVLIAFVEDRRAQPLVPEKTVEERVTIGDGDSAGLHLVFKDDAPRGPRMRYPDAIAFRIGLIAQLKQEGR